MRSHSLTRAPRRRRLLPGQGSASSSRATALSLLPRLRRRLTPPEEPAGNALTRDVSSSDDDAVAAAPQVAGSGEAAVSAHLDRGRAAEVEVGPTPANEVVADALEPVELALVAASFAVDVPVLNVDAWGRDRLFDSQSVPDDVHDYLEDRTAQPQRARAPDDQPGPAFLQDEGGRHHARQAQPGPGLAPGRTEVELPEHVVEVDAGARNDHAGSGARRHGQRGGVAALVHHRDVGGAALRPGLSAPRFGAPHPPSGLAHGLLCVKPPSETPAEQIPPEAVVPHPRLLAHDLDERCERLDAPGLPVGTEPVEQPQAVSDQHATGRGRRIRVELVPGERGADGATPDDPVLRKVAGGDRASVLARVETECAGKAASVELTRPALREQLQGAGEVAHHEPVAGHEAGAAALVDRPALVCMSQD